MLGDTNVSSSDPRGWLDRAVGTCLSVLLGAAALFIAVKLIEAIWTVLLIIAGVTAFAAATLAIMRARNRGW